MSFRNEKWSVSSPVRLSGEWRRVWYASLDCETTFKRDGPIQEGIDPQVVTAIAGELQSFASLSKKIENVDKALGDRVHALEKDQIKYHVIGAVSLTLLLALTVKWIAG